MRRPRRDPRRALARPASCGSQRSPSTAPGCPAPTGSPCGLLANSTSGYLDWIQGNDAFVDALFENPFKQWTVRELLATAFARGFACDPGACFHYAHTNFAVLAQVISKATGRSVQSLLHERVLAPLGLRHTAISRYPALPGPALHSYSSERGIYEGRDLEPVVDDWCGNCDERGDRRRGPDRAGGRDRRSDLPRRQPQALRARHARMAKGARYNGLGIVVAGGWRIQNPMLNGYTGIMAYPAAAPILGGDRHHHSAPQSRHRPAVRQRPARPPHQLPLAGAHVKFGG